MGRRERKNIDVITGDALIQNVRDAAGKFTESEMFFLQILVLLL